jgi:Papain-like cysteine protease AvrRpt2
MSTNLLFYHGTTLENAKKLMTMDIPVMEVPAQAILDYSEYTDFGKGFYTHPHESRHLAFEWAKGRYRDWGVVRFSLAKDALDKIAAGAILHFQNKKSRPANAPRLPNSGTNPASWLEFVEHNRHVGVSPARPKDNDWTARYGWMRGPLWVPRDSGINKGHPPFPDDVHQIDWGLEGLKIINSETAKKQRFLFTKDNEEDEELRPFSYMAPGIIQALRQPTDSVCWATAYAIMRSWKDCCSYAIRDAVAGVDEKYAVMVDKNQGLPPQEFTPFLRAASLQHQPMWNLTIQGWLKLLKRHGPLWVGTLGAAPPATSLHSRIVEGMRGNGDANDTWMKIVDPGKGSRYDERFSSFLAKYEGAFIQSQSGSAGVGEYYQIRHF